MLQPLSPSHLGLLATTINEFSSPCCESVEAEYSQNRGFTKQTWTKPQPIPFLLDPDLYTPHVPADRHLQGKSKAPFLFLGHLGRAPSKARGTRQRTQILLSGTPLRPGFFNWKWKGPHSACLSHLTGDREPGRLLVNVSALKTSHQQ